MRNLSLSYLKMFMPRNLPSHTYKLPCRGITNYNKTATKESTIDQSHVDKHSKLAKEWWDPNGKMMALHSYNLLRVQFVRDGLVYCEPHERTLTPLFNKKILDVGCGGGILSEAIARLGANVTGIDASNELIELASEHCKLDPKLENNRPCYQCATIEVETFNSAESEQIELLTFGARVSYNVQYTFEHAKNFPDYYDAVVASEVIEHVANKELFIKSCIEAVAPGGKIFITTPNRTRTMQILGIWVAEYILKSVPVNTHDYERLTTPNEVTFLLERNNCHVQVIHGLMYYPIINKWTWSNSTTFVFALQAEKLANE